MKRLSLYTGLLLGLCLLLQTNLYATNEPYAAKPLKGNQLRVDSFSIVSDTTYIRPELRPTQTTFKVRNLITFKINEFANLLLPNSFSCTINLKINYTKNGSNNQPASDSFVNVPLTIGYDKNGVYQQKAIYTFLGGHEVKVKITNISANFATLAQIENSLMLENELFVTREYNFSCTDNAIKTLNSPSFKNDKGELEVSWMGDRRADEYDLEWTYIDELALANYRNPSDTTQYYRDQIFKRNATRVSITQTKYLVPMVYDGAGRLCYRVRAVQTKANGQRIESAWSTDYTSGFGMFPFGGHENKYNWQATTSFAEEGKRKTVVQYFDGSLRNRQTVTKDNTTDTTLVAETFYDFQGRPAIQVLPTPTLSGIIGFTPNFNSPLNVAEYSKDMYDGDLEDSCYCKEGAPQMDTLKGASRYYSQNNPLVNTGIHKNIPEAKGFPFAETRYTPDNTGRLSMQSGVGPAFRIDSGRATRYYYSSAEQEELDALFGTEVGNAAHYFKNMVRDANGQYSISYVDMHGRTIATALAGMPDAKLDLLASNQPLSIKKKLIDSSTNVIKGTSIVSTKGLIVAKRGKHVFYYSLLPDSINIKDKNNVNVCYDCSYDLEITITDDCNNSTLPNDQPYIIRANNLTLDTLCNPNTLFPGAQGLKDSLVLDPGNYTITKTLTISQQSMDRYREIFIRRNTVKTLDQFIAEQKASLILQCQPSCESCKTALGTWDTFRPDYMQRMGIPTADTANYRTAALNAWTNLSLACEDLCLGRTIDKTYRAQMLADMTPSSGQYMDPANDDDPYSVLFAHGKMSYRNIQFKDENGNPDALNPHRLPVADFVAKFKASWAESLLTIHPEYHKLTLFESWKASHEWDLRFENTETYQAAVDSGYLNPANFSGLPAHARYAYVSQRADPFFTSLRTSAKSVMSDSLFNAAKVEGEPAISAWALATIMAHCKDGDESCRQTYSSLSQAFTMDAACSGELDVAWRYFREMYLQKKREIMDNIMTAYALDQLRGQDNYYSKLVEAGHALVFPSKEMLKTPGEEPMPETPQQGQAGIEAFVLDNCTAYALQWWNEMKPCNFSVTDSVSIITRLIQVCKEGGDENHMFGASTVKPSSTNLDRSFEQVMKAYAGSNYGKACNVYLITAPLPYERQPILYEKPLMQKPDSCECATIGKLYDKYLAAAADANFSDFLYRTTSTRIYQGVLDTLRMACNNQINCNMLKEPLSLPPVLQCGGGEEVCVTCVGIDTLYTKYKQEFPTALPVYAPADDAQRANNLLFERFMNSALGFAKNSAEYLDFIASCGPIANDEYCNVALAYGGNAAKRRVTIPVRNRRLKLGKGDFTIEARIKPKANGSINQIMSNRTYVSGSNANGFSFLVLSNSRLLFQLQGCFNYQVTTTAGIDMYDGKPHHVAVSRKGDSLGFYMDGIKLPYSYDCTDGALTTPPSQRDISTDGPWYIGFDSAHNSSTTYGFNGWIDEVRMWNVARTQEQINATRNVKLSPQANLVGYYLLRSKDTCTQVLTDYSIIDTVLKNNGYLGKSSAKDNYDAIWQSKTQVSYVAADPVGVTNTCNCSGPTPDPEKETLRYLLDEYKKYGGIPHLDASGADTTRWRPNFGGIRYKLGVPFADVVSNGVLSLPRNYSDTLPDAFPYKNVDLDFYDTLCFDPAGFDIEWRIKQPDSVDITNSYHDKFWLFAISKNQPSGTVLGSIKYADNGAAICTHHGLPSMVCTPEMVPIQSLEDWRLLKFEFRGTRFRFYIDNTLLGEKTLDAPMTVFEGLSTVCYSQRTQIDFIKIRDVQGRLIYNEEFNDPWHLAIPTRSVECEGCEPNFAAYYNQKRSTSLTYSQIATLYQQAGIRLAACTPEELTLCGRAEPSFPPVKVVQHTACDDSTLFAVSKGTLLYEAYRDSLIGSFNDKYLAKCLNARYNETFTVDQPVSEYHYTLYYYDQAGNLVKTVSPAGVDVSKFAWAAAYSDTVRLARRNRQSKTPNHKLYTDYRYNTLNQVVQQTSPDGGTTNFWYDRLGRLAVSQNAKQKAVGSSNDQDRQYSYTQYDNIGRIAEVGQVSNTSANGAMTNVKSRSQEQLNDWMLALINRREQITQTVYDLPWSGFVGSPDPNTINQRNLRNRVSYVSFTDNSNPAAFNQATFYSYDILGNVDTLLQNYGHSSMKPNIMNKNLNSSKKFVYQYDLISGKVNMAMYQPGWNDMLLHRYTYDAENRLTLVETSIDSLVWERDARYEYYRHGGLARTIIGDQLVQGIDYAYTLQGWLKGINSTKTIAANDMGEDGNLTGINKYVARDALGISLNYYNGDYSTISKQVTPFPQYVGLTSGGLPATEYRPLYNGNISSSLNTLRSLGNYTYLYNYRYDQLNRLTGQDAWREQNTTANNLNSLVATLSYKERVSYDANGNILKYLRANLGDWDNDMDSLTYNYYPNTNQLKYVRDAIADSKYGSQSYEVIEDIDNQPDSNYAYDAIGNLILDKKERILDIKWNVYGKIAEIKRDGQTTEKMARPMYWMKYTYDAQGNRIGKTAKVYNKGASRFELDYTWYVRDAQGNLMCTYNATGLDTLGDDMQDLYMEYRDHQIYGSSRLGGMGDYGDVKNGPVSRQTTMPSGYSRGVRAYELTNHLANVLTTISDKKIGVSSGGIGSLIDYYEPDMVGGQDYFPFGMISRYAPPTTGKGYKYGFNGKENDNEVKGNGNQQDYGARMYDSRIGKWLSVDPLFREYSHISPYTFMSNDPINRIDPTGMGDYYGRDGKKLGSDGKMITVGKGKSAKQVSDDKAYTTSQSIINQFTKDGVTDWDQVLANSGTSELSVSNSTLNMFANTVAGESSGDKLESYALASAVVNISKHRNKTILRTLQTEGIYGYRDGGNSPAYKNNVEYGMEAAINALTGGFDYSYGAIRWDGFDLAAKGYNHIKPTTYGVEISHAHYSAFKNAWPNAVIKAFSGGKYTSFASNFSSGIHLASSGDNKGRCLLMSTAVHGKTIFWGTNRDPVQLIHESPPGIPPYEFMLNYTPKVVGEKHINAGFKDWKGL
ncbi:LamG-like jellyroll fold domain-containing protein [Paraflavitalea sp. CAU 1676]|uniref:LamG-like jellyroll fold domain-containing protein n=1 Tax=Paraflavitalea sp. CAU 1676 TaxID=3032598 RepID=UPI0023DA9707|nr:LamG-like jellyroll fold domain-containing protein [Paraflavitalea sp. CAU 1676]MDF2188425.1 hypothetical protein [Paraflavitalea sp. CAU 1676]